MRFSNDVKGQRLVNSRSNVRWVKFLVFFSISIIPYTKKQGMLLGSYFWGCLADTKGRKVVLIATLLLDGICGLISSVSQYYSLFLVLRFFNGFGVAGAMGICFPYLGKKWKCELWELTARRFIFIEVFFFFLIYRWISAD